MQVDAGGAAYLTCVGYGIFPANITWERYGTTASYDSQTVIHEKTFIRSGIMYVESVFEICNAGEMHTGIYRCIVENAVGSKNASFELLVRIEGKKQYFKQFACCT